MTRNAALLSVTGEDVTRELKSVECGTESDRDLDEIVDLLRPLVVELVGTSGAETEKGESSILSIE